MVAEVRWPLSSNQVPVPARGTSYGNGNIHQTAFNDLDKRCWMRNGMENLYKWIKGGGEIISIIFSIDQKGGEGIDAWLELFNFFFQAADSG